MKCLLIQDITYEWYGERVYHRDFHAELIKERFLSVFDAVEVCGKSVDATSDPEGKISLADDAQNPNVEFCRGIPKMAGPRLYFNRKTRKIVKAAIARCDCAIIRLPGFLSLLAINECRRRHRPYLIEMVGDPFGVMWYHNQMIGKLIAPILAIATKKALRDCNQALYISRFLCERFPTRGSYVICSDVCLEHNDLHLDKRIQRIDNRTGRIVIGTAGAVNMKYKGQQAVIRALKRLNRTEGIRYEYQMAGGGDSSYLRSVAARNNVEQFVCFVGALDRRNMEDWYDQIDLYVQPSKTEAFGRSIAEAMNRGCCVLGSNTGGIPELIDADCLVRNNRHKSEDIARKIAENSASERLTLHAKRNIEKAKAYDKTELDRLRLKFYQDFASYVRETAEKETR